MADQRRTILILSQTYNPDPAAVGQYMHDAAAELVRRGHRVIVYASSRGYDDPTKRYPRRETRDGVTIRRLPLTSFGKGSIKQRLLGGLLFCLLAAMRGLFILRLDAVLVSTSPPMAASAAIFLRAARRTPFVFWAMDINPDQAIRMGKVAPGSAFARAMNRLYRATLRRAAAVVALDHFMAKTLEQKEPVGDRLHVLPPWPLDNHVEPVNHAENPFRAEHGLADKFVFMYSGNISPAHPLDAVLDTAAALRHREDIVFLFIGSDTARAPIEARARRDRLTNLRTLPYQPIDQLRYSLSAADVHIVAMGPDMVGLVHPCKVYTAMAVARPILLVGPPACHVGELIDAHRIGWVLDQGTGGRGQGSGGEQESGRTEEQETEDRDRSRPRPSFSNPTDERGVRGAHQEREGQDSEVSDTNYERPTMNSPHPPSHIPHPPPPTPLLARIAETPKQDLTAMGERARAAVRDELSRATLCGRFCEIIETVSHKR